MYNNVGYVCFNDCMNRNVYNPIHYSNICSNKEIVSFYKIRVQLGLFWFEFLY